VAARDGEMSADRPAARCLCIVMACADIDEADQVSRQLQQLDSGYLVTYRRAADLVRNAPAGQVALVILATKDSPKTVSRTLKWLRHRWSRCPITVVGDLGSGELELAARKEAALYLARPVGSEQWKALLTHALGQGRLRQAEYGHRL